MHQKIHETQPLPAVSIRPVETEDFIALSKLYGYYAASTIFTYYDGHVTPQYMQGLLTGFGHQSAVAVVDGEVVGYVHISPSTIIRPRRGDIAIYLFPQYTKKGIGTQLLRYGEAMAYEKGILTLGASVCTENFASLMLFERNGYKRTYVKTNAAYKLGRHLHTQYFDKKLNPEEFA
ncbi:GNAT family N-acetyltransferase [Eubacteriales bacterium OttesenSCG-928-N14]|nr:GNAT family N-acetyltransferase [Eubacteriales bacterium OttesenSCG-928-N14]